MFCLRSQHPHFNPRSPHGERPRPRNNERQGFRISIHAPRTGSDKDGRIHQRGRGNFNPRSPHGERRPTLRDKVFKAHFNPRSPHGERRRYFYSVRDFDEISIHAPRTGSDTHLSTRSDDGCISIHAPRTGSDAVEQRTDLGAGYFNPRSPHGERHGDGIRPAEPKVFQSTLPARGAT